MVTDRKPRIATVWLGGCSGCHMSFLDMDERLLELADRAEIVHSPVADIKTFPPGVDVALVEGAVASTEHEHLARVIRRNARIVVSFGDCAVSGNVTALRNTFPLAAVTDRAYGELGDGRPARPDDYASVARLLPTARPLHEYIPVDAFLHGCPPTADQIWYAVSALLEGKMPAVTPVFLRYG